MNKTFANLFITDGKVRNCKLILMFPNDKNKIWK